MSSIGKPCLLIFLIGSLLSGTAKPLTAQPRSIPAMRLEISSDQTSVLLFPASIKSVDRGNSWILSKTLKDASNVLKLKAASDSMPLTSLHVFTSDGAVYAFEVCYHPSPPNLTIDLTGQKTSGIDSSPVSFDPGKLNDAQVVSYANLVAGLRPTRSTPRSKRKGSAKLSIIGTYYIKGVLYFQLSLVNVAVIPYTPDFTRMYVRDKKKSRRTSITEEEITPIHRVIQNQSDNYIQRTILVLAFDQFTISDSKYMVIEVFEKNGDRLLSCRLKGKELLRARKLLQPSFEAVIRK